MFMPQTKPRFDGTIQLGHILQILTLVGVIIGAWYNMRILLDQNARDLSRHEIEIRGLHADDASIRATQSQLSDNLTRLTAIIEERTHHAP